ncbi:MAG: hypothetical protein QM767_28205 [Anaeromyxobacter sp.]
MLAPAALVLALPFAVPQFRAKLFSGPAMELADGLRQDYEKAHDLLEHYYRPAALQTAIPILERIIEKNPSFAPAYSDLGRANAQQYIQAKDPKTLTAARTASLKALQLKPDLASAHVTLAMLDTRTDQYDLASQELDEAERLDKHSGAVFAARGNLLLRRPATKKRRPP